MPPQKQAEQDPNRPRTRAKNASAHPGIAAKNALRVRNPPRDPDVIQKEKDDKEAKKIAKQKTHEEMQEKEESAAYFVEEYRARKDAEALKDSMPRHMRTKGQYPSMPEITNSFLMLYTASKDVPQGPRHDRHSESENADNAKAGKASNSADNRGAKNTSNAIPEAVVKPAQKQGTKRKANDRLETEGDNADKSVSVPPKKTKTTEAPKKANTTNKVPKSTPARIKKPAAASSRAGEISKSPKKRSSPTDNEGTATTMDPKTPAPRPLKKPRVSESNNAHKAISRKPQLLRRSGIISESLILK
jgi:hypothetical protein